MLSTIIMKIKLPYIIFIFLLILFLSNSCRKSIFNYRYKYIDEWDFTTVCSCVAPPNYDTSTTYFYHGTISWGENKNEIKINYYLNCHVTLVVENRTLIDPNQNEVGYIHGKKLSVTLKEWMPGSTYTTTISGVKK